MQRRWCACDRTRCLQSVLQGTKIETPTGRSRNWALQGFDHRLAAALALFPQLEPCALRGYLVCVGHEANAGSAPGVERFCVACNYEGQVLPLVKASLQQGYQVMKIVRTLPPRKMEGAGLRPAAQNDEVCLQAVNPVSERSTQRLAVA